MVWNDGYQLVSATASPEPKCLRQSDVPEETSSNRASSDLARTVGDKAMRSIEYDVVSDQYDRFLNEELLPEFMPNTTSGAMHTVTPLRGTRRAAFVPSTPPGGIRII